MFRAQGVDKRLRSRREAQVAPDSDQRFGRVTGSLAMLDTRCNGGGTRSQQTTMPRCSKLILCRSTSSGGIFSATEAASSTDTGTSDGKAARAPRPDPAGEPLRRDTRPRSGCARRPIAGAVANLPARASWRDRGLGGRRRCLRSPKGGARHFAPGEHHRRSPSVAACQASPHPCQG